MEVFKQRIPEGYSAEIDNGDIVYYPIMHEDKSIFEVGDIVFFGGIMRVIEGFDNYGYVKSSKKLQDDKLCSELYGAYGSVYLYTKAKQEQEKLFKQKCLENGVWFDKENKKWIELKEGGVYTIEDFIFIYGKYVESDNSLKFKAALKNKSYIDIYDKGLTIRRADWGSISEATEEEKQRLFDALKEKGKQWNAEKKCVEDLRWKPEEGDTYFFMDTTYEPYLTTNELLCGDLERITVGNCFKTEDECEKYAEYMLKCSLNYKPE